MLNNKIKQKERISYSGISIPFILIHFLNSTTEYKNSRV